MPHQENKNVALSYTMPFNGKLDSAGTDVSQRLIHKAMNQTGQRLFILLRHSVLEETANP